MNTKLLNTIPLDGGVIIKKGSGGGKNAYHETLDVYSTDNGDVRFQLDFTEGIWYDAYGNTVVEKDESGLPVFYFTRANIGAFGERTAYKFRINPANDISLVIIDMDGWANNINVSRGMNELTEILPNLFSTIREVYVTNNVSGFQYRIILSEE